MNKNTLFTTVKNKLKDYFRIVVLVISFAFIISLAKNIIAINKSQTKIQDAEEIVASLKEKNEELKKDLEKVESDFYIESQLRDSLGLAREGEIVVVLPEDEVLRRLAPKLKREDDKLPDPNWKKWMELFL